MRRCAAAHARVAAYACASRALLVPTQARHVEVRQKTEAAHSRRSTAFSSTPLKPSTFGEASSTHATTTHAIASAGAAAESGGRMNTNRRVRWTVNPTLAASAESDAKPYSSKAAAKQLVQKKRSSGGSVVAELRTIGSSRSGAVASESCFSKRRVALRPPHAQRRRLPSAVAALRMRCAESSDAGADEDRDRERGALSAVSAGNSVPH